MGMKKLLFLTKKIISCVRFQKIQSDKSRVRARDHYQVSCKARQPMHGCLVAESWPKAAYRIFIVLIKRDFFNFPVIKRLQIKLAIISTNRNDGYIGSNGDTSTSEFRFSDKRTLLLLCIRFSDRDRSNMLYK